MNQRIQNRSDAASDDSRFDRLVDGELSSDEYRALLAALDDEPGGWRRCALAFLEAQALTGELGSLHQPAPLRDDVGVESQAKLTRRSKQGQWPTLLAVAASFFVAFGLGIVAPRFFPRGPQEQPLAGNLNTQSPRTTDAATADEIPYRTLRPVGNVTLTMDGLTGDTTQAGQVPVYEAGPGLEQFVGADRPALGPELIELLRRHGFDVQHEQQYFPAPLDDGRQIIVPVEGYQITPVSRRY